VEGGSKGAYAETWNASIYEEQNTPNRDTEGINRLNLCISDDAVVK